MKPARYLAPVLGAVLSIVLALSAQGMTIIGHGGSGGGTITPDSTNDQINTWKHARCAESDARLTSDHKMVQMHDADASHTTNAPRGFIVEDHTLAELRRYHLNDGQQIPTLRQGMRAVKVHKGCLLMELKTPNWTPADFRLIQRQAVRMGVVKGFRLYVAWKVLLERAQSDAPKMRTAWKMIGPTDMPSIRKYDPWAVVPRGGGIYRKNVNRIHDTGAKVYAALSDRIDEWQRNKRAGVDGFLTNRPAAAARWFRTH